MLKPQLNIVAGALLFSTGGVAIKLSTLTGWQVSCLRSLIAGVVLLMLFPRLGSRWTRRSLIVAIPYAATFTLFALANKLTTAANAIFLQDTAPLYVLLLGPLLLKERIRCADVGFMAALAAGLGLIFASTSEPSATAANPALGDILGGCSGLSWALTVLGLRWLAVRSVDEPEHPIAAVIAGCFLSAAIGAGLSFPFEEASLGNGIIVLYLGVFQVALAYVFIAEGMRQVPAFEASLLLLVEPVFSPVWVWLVLNEVPRLLALAGGAIVLGAAVLYTRQRDRRAGAAPA